MSKETFWTQISTLPTMNHSKTKQMNLGNCDFRLKIEQWLDELGTLLDMENSCSWQHTNWWFDFRSSWILWFSWDLFTFFYLKKHNQVRQKLRSWVDWWIRGKCCSLRCIKSARKSTNPSTLSWLLHVEVFNSHYGWWTQMFGRMCDHNHRCWLNMDHAGLCK